MRDKKRRISAVFGLSILLAIAVTAAIENIDLRRRLDIAQAHADTCENDIRELIELTEARP